MTTPHAAAPQPNTAPASPRPSDRVWPGLTVSMLVGAACLALGPRLGGISPLLLAIVVGALIRNTVPVPDVLSPGVAVAGRSLLRWGVVLLGLQLSLGDLLALGPGVLFIVVAAVGVTFVGTRLLGRALGVDPELTTLIAAGFSICGAAAVAGAQGVVRAAQEKVASAIALVVLFGTAMIPIMVSVSAALALPTGSAGTLMGGTIHEVAQVVAAAGIAGGAGLLAIAVPIKLARVVLLAPMVAFLAVAARRESAGTPGVRPPILPLFVVGFLIAIGIATTGWLPASILAPAQVIQQFLLASAMFALGLGVHVRSLITLGWRPMLLGLLATLLIVSVVTLGIVLGFGVRAA